jgi:hypothetical protein
MIEDDPKIKMGEIRGKQRGNLECGSAQPSLFMLSMYYIIIVSLPFNHKFSCQIWY